MYHELVCDAGVSPSEPKGQLAWWVDDTGRALPHSTINNEKDTRRFAFRHLGMTEILGRGGHLCVRWDVARVAFGSLTAVLNCLMALDANYRVRLEFFWGAWASESGYTPNAAADRMIRTMAYADVEPFLGTTVLQSDPANVRKDSGLVRSAFEGWDSRRGLACSSTNDHGDDSLAPYLLGFQHNRSETDLLVSHVGDDSSAARVFGADWAADAVGRVATRSQPDYEFDERVCDVYDDVMADGGIRIDHVQALIRRPDNDPIWVPYVRLLLRTRDEYGTPTLLSAVEMRPDIDVPFMAA